MICAIAFHSGDVLRAQDLLEWIGVLGGAKNHDVLLVSDASVPWEEAMSCLELARKWFREADMISVEPPKKGWPQASNFMFLSAAEYTLQENHSSGVSPIASLYVPVGLTIWSSNIDSAGSLSWAHWCAAHRWDFLQFLWADARCIRQMPLNACGRFAQAQGPGMWHQQRVLCRSPPVRN